MPRDDVERVENVRNALANASVSEGKLRGNGFPPPLLASTPLLLPLFLPSKTVQYAPTHPFDPLPATPITSFPLVPFRSTPLPLVRFISLSRHSLRQLL